MLIPAQIAKHTREVYFGGNWTTSNLKDQLADVSWQVATTPIYSLNTIATLTYHIHYYIRAVLKVIQGGPLDAKDQYSFDHPPIQSSSDWDQFLDQIWTEAETFAGLIEKMPESQLHQNLADEKYGNYFRNLLGIIEHTHYHLGQIAVIKKIFTQKNHPDQ